MKRLNPRLLLSIGHLRLGYGPIMKHRASQFGHAFVRVQLDPTNTASEWARVPKSTSAEFRAQRSFQPNYSGVL